jgi:hypothetical protein
MAPGNRQIAIYLAWKVWRRIWSRHPLLAESGASDTAINAPSGALIGTLALASLAVIRYRPPNNRRR